MPGISERSNYALLPCGVVCTDLHHRIRYVNPYLLDLLDQEEQQLVGQRSFVDLLSIGGKLYFETYFVPALDLDGQVKETNFEVVAKSGHRYSVLVNVKRQDTPWEGFVYVVFPCADRREYENELKRARTEAEQIAKARTTFVSSMSHEIRTPLHALLEAGNFLLKDDPRPDQLEFIQVLRQAGNSLLGIVNDILDISKMESGMMTLDAHPFHAEQLIGQVIQTYRPQCRERNVDLRAQLPLHNIPLLVVDTGKLLQVLNNLVSNAAKFTREGEIVVQLVHKEFQGRHELNFTVRDTGVGIPADRLEAVFDPFVQARNSTEANFGGTGLGLAICQRILAAYGSELEVTSKEGQGTEFSFSLHLQVATEEQRRADQRTIRTKEDLAPLNHLRVLNVDDNRANLLINARYFKEWKLDFDQVSSGKQALEAIAAERYDLVLLDLRMPDMDGYELARRIRQSTNPEVRMLPLIALSASASKEVSAQMLDAGINGLVVKPFEPDYLHYMIRVNGERGIEQRKSGVLQVPAADLPVNYDQVRAIFAGDVEDYRNFLAIVHTDMVEAAKVLRNCCQSFSRKDFGELKHSLISTLRVFELDHVTEAFERAATALVEEDRLRFLVETNQLIDNVEAFDRALVLERDSVTELPEPGE